MAAPWRGDVADGPRSARYGCPVPQIIDFRTTSTDIAGLHLIRMKQVVEDRGTVREFYRASAFAAAGIDLPSFPQINVTETLPGAIRGMHGEPMVKVIAIAHGTAYGAWVDTRDGSPTRGAVVQQELEPGVQIVVPDGVCNGFQSTSDTPTQYVYCFTSEWVPGMGGVAINPLDPALGIRWPLEVGRDDRTKLSQKDLDAPTLAQVLG
jgi:dTDP-4-dehydrorhamnose 3,5-epimerase